MTTFPPTAKREDEDPSSILGFQQSTAKEQGGRQKLQVTQSRAVPRAKLKVQCRVINLCPSTRPPPTSTSHSSQAIRAVTASAGPGLTRSTAAASSRSSPSSTCAWPGCSPGRRLSATSAALWCVSTQSSVFCLNIQQFAVGWWFFIDGVAFASSRNPPLAQHVRFEDYVPGILSTLSLIVCVSFCFTGFELITDVE
ncbi:hypothetical protein HK096_003539 [Nowakowskiella sp. JEL0078]|nr:hypothetical protein HK096_003539 [Nowakowskiella sp. JEL0078]